ncbi:MAG TPA: cytochrome P450, partial [Mycobacterium sp.]|nr:cytochrome P450 [Mycobacterium sp.]
LSSHPEQRALLTREPGTVPLAVEEMLRWSTPVMHFRRTVTSDVEIGDRRIPAGDWVLLHYLSANRDEEVFERADEFDVTREDAGHAAFGGGGTHFCLGAQLARLELRVLIEELYSHVPELAVTGPPDRLRSSFFHGIKRLPCSTGGVR